VAAAGDTGAAEHTSLSFLDAAGDRLYYRGYDAVELARLASFEEAAFLLWHGRLPGAAELADLRHQLAAARVLPSAMLAVAAALPRELRPVAAVRTLLSSSPKPSDAESGGEAIQLTGRIAALTALVHRHRLGLPPMAAPAELGQAGSLLALLIGLEPDASRVRALDAALILHLDLALNASTYAARVAASTGAELDAAVAAALATLEGRLHGGASAEVLATLERIGTPERAGDYVLQALARKQRLPGFGHRHFKGIDPRAVALKELSRTFAGGGDARLHDVAEALETAMAGARGLRANVDLYAATLFHALGFPADLFVLLFAAARVVGWTAHALEQRAEDRVIWPACEYIGPTPRPLPSRGNP